MVGLGKPTARHAACEGSDSCQETREEGTSLSGLCCLAVPSQLLEASVQEEGSALHKLVGDLVNSHRLLRLFVIVSPVLWGEMAVLASAGSLGQCGEEHYDLKAQFRL